MPNLYSTLGTLKADLGKANTADDATLLRALERASREIDDRTCRRFYSEIATAYYDARGGRVLRLHTCQRDRFRGDLLSVSTSLKVDDNRDSTFELTLAANTDYWLASLGAGGAYETIELNTYTSQIAAWPTALRSVELIGTFGFANETEASGTLGAAISDTSGTSVTMTAGHGLTGGETIIVGTEHMHVSSVSTNTLTVVRGINGTTAATASNGATVTRRRYPRPIEQACVIRAADIWRGTQTGYGQVGDAGGYQSNTSYAQFRGLIREYEFPGLA